MHILHNKKILKLLAYLFINTGLALGSIPTWQYDQTPDGIYLMKIMGGAGRSPIFSVHQDMPHFYTYANHDRILPAAKRTSIRVDPDHILNHPFPAWVGTLHVSEYAEYSLKRTYTDGRPMLFFGGYPNAPRPLPLVFRAGDVIGGLVNTGSYMLAPLQAKCDTAFTADISPIEFFKESINLGMMYARITVWPAFHLYCNPDMLRSEPTNLPTVYHIHLLTDALIHTHLLVEAQHRLVGAAPLHLLRPTPPLDLESLLKSDHPSPSCHHL